MTVIILTLLRFKYHTPHRYSEHKEALFRRVLFLLSPTRSFKASEAGGNGLLQEPTSLTQERVILALWSTTQMGCRITTIFTA